MPVKSISKYISKYYRQKAAQKEGITAQELNNIMK